METLISVGVATAVFSGIIVGLVGILMAARKQLVPQGEVSIRINEDPELTQKVAPGQSLLSALAAQKIFIPSACGGGGTCAQCKCQVLDGGGDVLATETSHLSLREQKDHWRLACQVKVKQDMHIEVEPELFGVRQWKCKVRSNNNVATFIKELVLELPEGENVPFRAGGYIQIDCPPHLVKYADFDIDDDYRADWDKFGMWGFVSNVTEEVSRAYSMANYPEEEGIIMLNVRIASPPWDRANNCWQDVPPGIMSSYIFGLKEGDEVVISGPYGEFFAKETDAERKQRLRSAQIPLVHSHRGARRTARRMRPSLAQPPRAKALLWRRSLAGDAQAQGLRD